MTTDIILVLSVLGVTIFLFVSEWLRVDIIAILVMVALGWLGVVTPEEAVSGLASNAVISIIAVMILGYGVDRSGVMNKIAQPIVRAAGHSEKRLVGLVCTVIGFMSAFMQNIGSAALFLPAMLRISKTASIPASRLLMPMGFAAILGGCLSMVGSSPLLILNDLMAQGAEQPYGLFSVTPLGLMLLAVGVAYFLFFGKRVLPPEKAPEDIAASSQKELVSAWQLPTTIYQVFIPPGSPLVGKTREEVRVRVQYGVNILAFAEGSDVHYAPWRHTPFRAGQEIAVLGKLTDVQYFVADLGLEVRPFASRFRDLESGGLGGFAELIIPPRSPAAGKTVREVEIRKTYGVEPIMTLIGDKEDRGDFSDQILQPGEALIVHGPWANIRKMGDNVRFVLVTPIPSVETMRLTKAKRATICFVGAIALALSGAPISLSLLTGAVAMMILRVFPINEVYHAIDWRTVFLLGGLIPLGIAMENTGAAAFVATQMMYVLKEGHPVWVFFTFGILATVFSLFMSNVAATVLLVPLAMITGHEMGIHARALALIVGICASNSFVLPTHQVNALLMSPGGYRNKDYIRAGGIMTIIFLVVAVGFIYFFY